MPQVFSVGSLDPVVLQRLRRKGKDENGGALGVQSIKIMVITKQLSLSLPFMFSIGLTRLFLMVKTPILYP